MRDEGLLPGQLDGGISDDSDVYEKEYPIIEAAHRKASDEMACFSGSNPIAPTLFDWDAWLRNNLTEAVRVEMRRGKRADQIHPIVEWDLAPQSVASETGRWARHEVILLLRTDNRCAFRVPATRLASVWRRKGPFLRELGVVPLVPFLYRIGSKV